jgi:hypothetical protein
MYLTKQRLSMTPEEIGLLLDSGATEEVRAA